ncbi:MAG: AraC family transcriptional regulator [Bacteroidota bacterium]
MKVRLHSKDLEELLLENSYPDSFSSTLRGGVTERTFPGELIGGSGSYQEIFMDNIHIGYGNIHVDRSLELRFETDMETVEMHFALRGMTQVEEDNSKRHFQFEGNQHNIIYSTNFEGRAFFSAAEGIKVFEVNLLPGFFKRFLPQEEKAFFRFLKAIDRRENSMLSPWHYPITPEMHWLIQEILNCRLKGLYKRFFLEAKVTELLLLQLEQISSKQDPRKYPLKKSDIERMYAVKDYLNDHLREACTLADLAHLFGTNEYSLKKGFKDVFGTTVFNYWSAVKMNHAKQLLLNNSLSIGEVADIIGYKNPQHFTTAFKRKFGYPPSQVR